MLAHMPLFRNEHYEEMEALYRWLSHPLPRQEQVQLMGKRMMSVPNYVLGDQLPHPLPTAKPNQRLLKKKSGKLKTMQLF